MENKTINIPPMAQTSAMDQLLTDLTTKRRGAKDRGDDALAAKLTAAVNALGFELEDRGNRTTIIRAIKVATASPEHNTE